MKTGIQPTQMYPERSNRPVFSPRIFKALVLTLILLLANAVCLQAATEPLLSSWYTTNSGQYARVYKTTSARTSGTSITTWTNQALPSYSDIQAVQYSSTWVYVQYAGLASHVMGPWLNPQGGVFQFWPTNQHGIRRFPRTPVVQSGTKDTTSGGYSGLFVNGVAIFNSLDGQAWDGSQIQGQAPHTQSTYYWHRNAPVAESFNFDYALGHQPPSGIYHTHQNPLGLRYQLGDHVDYNSSTKNYSETAASATKHSPIIGWAHDGYPIYGPYGYSSASNSASGIRRMVAGYVKRDGSNGTDSVDSNRSTIPAWYARFRLAHFGGSYSTTAGASRPAVNATYTLGTFAQDWAYLGDLGKTQGVDFDLDEYNGRLCYTPEFPNGTYAYFTTIDSSGSATYPYLLAFEFYGDAKGGSVANISESVTTQFAGGPNTALSLNTPAVNDETSTVTLTWSSVEGGTYQVESSPNQSTWTTQSASVTSGGTSTESSYTGTAGTAYARVTRTALASYDSATTGTFTSAQTDTESYTLGSFSISADPQSQTVNPGADVTFSVTVSGTGPFTYLWYKGVDSIPTATGSTYTINGVTGADAGTYKVVVTKGAVSVTSGNAVLSVNTAPSITQDPQSLTINEGANATFTVTATGTAPLGYQWKQGTSVINNATNNTYTITNATVANNGTYSVVVTNIAGSVTSGSATLTVTAPVNTAPTITTEPVSQTVSAGSSATFTVVASGTAPLSYQWKLGADPISGATSSSYTTTNAGIYTVVVTNPYGSDTSAEATLTVIAAGGTGDALLTSWFTAYSGRYARIYETDAAKLSGDTVTTWGNGSQNQTSPAYAGVQEIFYSTNWVYIRTTGLGVHIMGPWYDNAARSTIFVNKPVNQNVIYRFPRTPAIPGTKVNVGGEIGYMVDGVDLFDARDATSYSNANARDGDAPGTPSGLTGDGIWNRDAYMNEAITFDPAYAHQQNTGVYHYHASPIALRYMLGDHVDYNSSTKLYTESAGSPTKHSPIIAWSKDGYPIYGPYGYSTAADTNSGVRRMVSGFVLRDGANGTVNLTSTGRTTLPLWAQRSQNKTTLTSGQYGPAVNTSFPLGRYAEDNDFLGDLGKVQGTDYDLDEYNGRFCKTPEFPDGTYAYFSCISSAGAPTYPYNVGRQYYGNPTGGQVTNITETVTTNWVGGANVPIAMTKPVIDGADVVLMWSGVEGGTYQLERSTDLSTWDLFDETVYEEIPDGAVTVTYTTEFGPDNAFFRVKRSALAAYDNVGSASSGGTGGDTGGSGGGITSVSPTSAAASSTVTVTITLDVNANPALPPTQAVPSAVTIGGVSGTSIQRTSTNTVTASFTLGATASTNTVTVTFTNPQDSSTVSYTLTNGFTVTATGGGGGVVTFNATFPTNPPLPPQDAVQVAAVGAATATITSYDQGTGAVSLQFNDSTLAAGNYSATLKFTPPGGSQQTLTSSNSYTKN